jgi:tetratricopeptide (TPR) repeat protein
MLYSKALFFCSRFDEAAETLESLLTDYKHYTEAEIWLVRTHIQLENVAEAKLLGEEVLSRSPEDPRILGLLARISYIEDDYQRALEYYGKAILFEEELAINRIELAKIYSALLNPEQARVQLERSLILLSNDSPLRSGIRLLLEQESTGAFQ